MERSTKLSILSVVLVVGGMLAVTPMFVENYYRGRVRAALARYAAAGDPIDLKLIQNGPIPDDRNRGVQLLRLAKPMVDMPSEIRDLQSRLDEVDQPPLSAVDRERVADFLRRNLPSDAEFQAVLALTDIDWPSDGFNGVITHLQPLRTLASAVYDDARFAAEEGDGPRFARRVHQLLGIAEAAGSDTAMIGMFVEIGMDALAADLVCEHPVALSDGETLRLIAALLDEPRRVARHRKALELERAWVMDSILNPTTAGTLAGLPGRIYFAREGPAAADAMTLVRDTLLERSSVQADALLTRAKAAAAPMRFAPMSANDRLLGLVRRSRADLRLAAVALASRAWAGRHQRPPAVLSDLVPGFLPAVPLDPFDPADGPLLMSPDGRVVYSRGSNRIDDGGDLTMTDPLPGRSPDPWTAPDRGFSLSPSTSTRPAR